VTGVPSLKGIINKKGEKWSFFRLGKKSCLHNKGPGGKRYASRRVNGLLPKEKAPVSFSRRHSPNPDDFIVKC
jgi:hypothetical protein